MGGSFLAAAKVLTLYNKCIGNHTDPEAGVNGAGSEQFQPVPILNLIEGLSLISLLFFI